jgi:undecaprenyl-phosphate 4-deoxy-4-formamido-L-arabinose transferase
VNVSVVIPCYRSRATLPALVHGLREELGKVCDDFEVILVVDGSPDDTYAVAHELEREDPTRTRAVLLRRNYGQHNALLAGLNRARHGITVTMDDDLQHRPDQVSALLAPLADPLVDLVYGVPDAEEHGALRSFASRGVKLGLSLTGVPNAQMSGAFRAFRTELRDAFGASVDPFVSMDVVLSWTTTGVVGVPVRMDMREQGASGYTLRALARHTWNMVTGYGTAPLRAVFWLGILTALLGLGALLVVLGMYFSGHITVPGFTSMVCLMAIFSGVTMLSIGILGEYLGRLHFRSMHQPNYLVRIEMGGTTDPGGAAADAIARAVSERSSAR